MMAGHPAELDDSQAEADRRASLLAGKYAEEAPDNTS